MRAARVLLPVVLTMVWGVTGIYSAGQVPAAMAGAANRWLASLTPAQRQQAQFALDSSEFTRWHFIPSGAPPAFPRSGLTVKDMQPEQRRLAHDLLRSGLSQRGYLTATQIMELESTLGAIEAAQRAAGARTPFVRDSELYFFAVFGTPSAAGSWGWRVEGHHVSLHFTVAAGNITVSSPTFFGTNPADVKEGPKRGLRILGAAEDGARALVNGLDAAQRAKAVPAGAAPGDILTMTTVPATPLSPAGLPAAEMTAAQRGQLMSLVEFYTAQMHEEIAALRLAKLRQAGADKLAFTWIGDTAPGQKHYYRVQGPTFLIEYDNTQNDGNHVHSVWRDFDGDFGRDLLREHLAADHGQ